MGATANDGESSSTAEDSMSWKLIEGDSGGESHDKEKSEERDNSSSSISFSLDASEGRSLPNVLKRISNIVALKSNVSWV